jgi:hypothetical protein
MVTKEQAEIRTAEIDARLGVVRRMLDKKKIRGIRPLPKSSRAAFEKELENLIWERETLEGIN